MGGLPPSRPTPSWPRSSRPRGPGLAPALPSRPRAGSTRSALSAASFLCLPPPTSPPTTFWQKSSASSTHRTSGTRAKPIGSTATQTLHPQPHPQHRPPRAPLPVCLFLLLSPHPLLPPPRSPSRSLSVSNSKSAASPRCPCTASASSVSLVIHGTILASAMLL